MRIFNSISSKATEICVKKYDLHPIYSNIFIFYDTALVEMKMHYMV